jgi:hypothetical protein
MAWQPLGALGRLIFRGFTITLFRHTTFGRTPLDEWPARRRDLYLTTHNTHKRQTSLPPVGWTHNPSKRAATEARLRPHGHWDRRSFILLCLYKEAGGNYKLVIQLSSLYLVVFPFCRLLSYQGHHHGIYHHFTLMIVFFHHLSLYNQMLIEVFALLGCYAALISNWLLTFWYSPSVASSVVKPKQSWLRDPWRWDR